MHQEANLRNLIGEKNLNMYKITLRKQAKKQLPFINANKSLAKKLAELFEIIEKNPFEPPFEKMSGDMSGAYSRRINIKHRLIYTIDEVNKEILVHSFWSHYEF